jgi:plasmid stabilization system protein ParE
VRPIRFDPGAAQELSDALDWYAERGPGLPIRLVEELDAALEQVSHHPDRFAALAIPRVEPPLRRVLLRRFPYAVIYCALSDEIRIVALAHASRRPLYWSDRLDE